MRFLIDENLPLSLGSIFKQNRHEAEFVKNTKELRGKPDEVIFEYAATNGLMIVTRDLNIANPIRFKLEKVIGIVVLRFPNDVSIERIIQEIGNVMSQLTEEQWRQLVVIEPGSVRLRKLL